MVVDFLFWLPFVASDRIFTQLIQHRVTFGDDAGTEELSNFYL